MKAAEEAAISAGWYAAAFARTEKLKPLSEMLKPPPTLEEKRDAGSVRLVAMLERMERRSRSAAKPEADKQGSGDAQENHRDP